MVQDRHTADKEILDSAMVLPSMDDQRRQEACYYIMTDLLDHVVWQFDIATMTITDVSPSVKRLRGYEPADLVGVRINEVFIPASCCLIMEKLSSWLDFASAVPVEESKFVGTVEQLNKDGSTVWAQMAISLFCRQDGGVEAIGISRDLGQQENRTTVCQQLAENSRLWQMIWNAMPCLLACTDRNGKFLHVNEQYANYYSLDRNRIPGRHFSEVLSPEIYEKHALLFADCLQGKTVEFLDKGRAAGAVYDHYCCGVYTPVLSSDGEVEMIVGAIMDITEQQNLQLQLSQAEIVGQTGWWRMHLRTRRLFCSDGLLVLLGSCRDEVAGDAYNCMYSRLQQHDRENLDRWLDPEWLALRQSLVAELMLTLPDGTRRLVRTVGQVLKDNAGKPLELLGTMVDITQQRALVDIEREAAFRLREFSRMMSGLGLIVDIEGTVIEVFDDNRLLTRTAKDAERWPGMSLTGLLPPEAARQLISRICYAVDKNMLQFGEYILDIARGRRIFDVRIAPLNYLRAGKATVACYFTDTTDQNDTKKLLQLTYEKRRQRDLLNNLFEGKIKPSQEVLDQAWQVKLNLAQDFSCYLLVLERLAGQAFHEWQERREELQLVVDSLIAGFSAEPGVIAWESKDGIVLLLPAGTDEPVKQSQEVEQAERWQEVMQQYAPDAQYRIGIAEFHAGTFWQASKVYAQACTAVELGRKLALGHVVYHYLDIGVLQFFPAIADRGHVTDFVCRTLGKLMEYDRTQGTELIDTLETILQVDNLKAVAEQFFVHRQTILFRKRRIEMVLGVSLDDFETRLALGMALKFRKVFGEIEEGI